MKERVLVHQFTSYVNLYDTTLNVETAMKEINNYFDEQREIKRKEDQRGNFHPPVREASREPLFQQ